MQKTKRNATFKNDGYIVEAGFRVRKVERKTGTRYQVDLGRGGGRHIRKTFRTLNEAKLFASRKRKERRQKGAEAHNLSDARRLEAIDCYERMSGTGGTLRDAVDYYLSHHPAQTKRETRLGKLAEYYLAEKRAKVKGGDLRFDTWRDAASRLGKFTDGREDLPVQEVGPQDIADWLDREGFKPTNRSNYLRAVSVFMNWLVRNGDLVVNPAAKTPRKKIPNETPTLWTPSETSAIFKAATGLQRRDRDAFVCYLALSFFGGLRPDEAFKLSWRDADLSLAEIHIKSKVSKTGRARLVHCEPNLVEFLTAYRGRRRGRMWDVSQSTRRRRLQEVVERAGLRQWKKDAARHSFATFHLAKHGSIDLTCQELGHTSSQMLFNNYQGLARNRKKQAEKYFKITPKSLGATTGSMDGKSS